MNEPLIHGQTKIELYNPTTKVKIVNRSENTFQSAILQNFERQYGCFDASPYWVGASNSSGSHRPNTTWKNLIGGLLLFKNQIAVGTKYMPAGNLMVGNASVDLVHTGYPTEMGSYNGTESGASATAIRQVYDFATDQANGEIGCVCLTSFVGGAIGYGNTSGGSVINYQMGSGQKNGSFDNANRNYAYEAWSKNAQYNFSLTEGILTVTKTYRPITTGSVFEGWAKTITIDLDESLPAGMKSDVGMPEVVADGVIRMFVGNQTNIVSGGSAYYIEYNSANDTAQVKTLLNSSTKDVNVGYNTISKFFLGNYACLIAHYAWEIIDVSTGVLVYEFSQTDDYYGTGGAYDTQLDYFCDSIAFGLFCMIKGYQDSNMYIVDVVAQTEKPLNVQKKSGGGEIYSVCTQHGEYDIMRGILNYNRGIVIKNPLYLATINNLETSVTKTASQTMKVTYTITEV